MLPDSVVVVVVRTRPRAILLAMMTMRKSTHGFPFVFHIWVAYGAPLGGPLGRRSSANIILDCTKTCLYFKFDSISICVCKVPLCMPSVTSWPRFRFGLNTWKCNDGIYCRTWTTKVRVFWMAISAKVKISVKNQICLCLNLKQVFLIKRTFDTLHRTWA